MAPSRTLLPILLLALALAPMMASGLHPIAEEPDLAPSKVLPRVLAKYGHNSRLGKRAMYNFTAPCVDIQRIYNIMPNGSWGTILPGFGDSALVQIWWTLLQDCDNRFFSCKYMMLAYGAVPNQTLGNLPPELQSWWMMKKCDQNITGVEVPGAQNVSSIPFHVYATDDGSFLEKNRIPIIAIVILLTYIAGMSFLGRYLKTMDRKKPAKKEDKAPSLPPTEPPMNPQEFISSGYMYTRPLSPADSDLDSAYPQGMMGMQGEGGMSPMPDQYPAPSMGRMRNLPPPINTRRPGDVTPQVQGQMPQMTMSMAMAQGNVQGPPMSMQMGGPGGIDQGGYAMDQGMSRQMGAPGQGGGKKKGRNSGYQQM